MITNKETYYQLLGSGMFWELHPKLTGDWEKDKIILGISEENVILKFPTLEKYIEKLKEKELVYKDCLTCDSGMILLSDAINVLKEALEEIKIK